MNFLILLVSLSLLCQVHLSVGVTGEGHQVSKDLSTLANSIELDTSHRKCSGGWCYANLVGSFESWWNNLLFSNLSVSYQECFDHKCSEIVDPDVKNIFLEKNRIQNENLILNIKHCENITVNETGNQTVCTYTTIRINNHSQISRFSIICALLYDFFVAILWALLISFLLYFVLKAILWLHSHNKQN